MGCDLALPLSAASNVDQWVGRDGELRPASMPGRWKGQQMVHRQAAKPLALGESPCSSHLRQGVRLLDVQAPKKKVAPTPAAAKKVRQGHCPWKLAYCLQ